MTGWHINTLWMLSDFTPANGATWLIPRSHMQPAHDAPQAAWTHDEQLQPRLGAVHAAAPAGCVGGKFGDKWCWTNGVGADPHGAAGSQEASCVVAAAAFKAATLVAHRKRARLHATNAAALDLPIMHLAEHTQTGQQEERSCSRLRVQS